MEHVFGKNDGDWRRDVLACVDANSHELMVANLAISLEQTLYRIDALEAELAEARARVEELEAACAPLVRWREDLERIGRASFTPDDLTNIARAARPDGPRSTSDPAPSHGCSSGGGRAGVAGGSDEG